MTKSYRWCWGVISLVPMSYDKHYVLCDWDNRIPPLFFKGEVFKTPHGFHGIQAIQHNWGTMIKKLRKYECDPEYIRMTIKRHYATLEFHQSTKEIEVFENKPCFFAKFQRVENVVQNKMET